MECFLDYNDDRWQLGRAEFGFGGGDEITLLPSGDVYHRLLFFPPHPSNKTTRKTMPNLPPCADRTVST
jgi:hypothetical protein